jgi:hypothetical protein
MVGTTASPRRRASHAGLGLDDVGDRVAGVDVVVDEEHLARGEREVHQRLPSHTAALRGILLLRNPRAASG